MATKTHSEISPSNTHRWWNCPGSVALCTGLKGEESEHAQEGTVAHGLLERCLKSGTSPYDYVGQVIEDIDIEVDDEMAEAVAFAIGIIKGEQQKGGQTLIEVPITIVEGEERGTLDVAILRHYEHITVIDFKYGRGVLVSAEENKQLLDYLLGLSKMYDFETATLMIIQPRTTDQYNTWDVPEGYLAEYEEEHKRRILMTKDPAAMTISGDWCRFCKAKAICPELRQDLQTVVAPVQNTELIFPDVKGLPMVAMLKILDNKDRFEKWLAAVEAYAFSILEEGGQVPGYELAKKRAHRVWVNEEEVINTYGGEFDNAIYDVKLKSPAALEKLLGKERKKELEKLVTKPETGYTMKKSALPKE